MECSSAVFLALHRFIRSSPLMKKNMKKAEKFEGEEGEAVSYLYNRGYVLGILTEGLTYVR